MNNIIVSPHHLSTDIASQIYHKGGNAVDAAIATNLIQGIVAPETCGIAVSYTHLTLPTTIAV